MLLLYITLILTTVLCVSSSTVYNVTPDGNISTCYHCFTLQHYLSNDTRYLISNTQLHFLPGLHHLPTDLIIQNGHNISLIGSTTNGTAPDTVIQCASLVGIVMANITNLTIQNMIIKSCKAKHDLSSQHVQAAVFIKECHFVKLNSVHIYHDTNTISFLGFNVLGSSYFNEMKCHEIHFYYNETKVKTKSHDIFIKSFLATNHFSSKYGIYLSMSQSSYKIMLQVENTTLQKLRRSVFLYAESNSLANKNKVLINNCELHNNDNNLFYLENVSVINFSHCHLYHNGISAVNIRHADIVTFFSFNLKHSKCQKTLIIFCTSGVLIRISNVSNVCIMQCNIYGSKSTVLYASDSAVVLKNTNFSLIETPILNRLSTLQLHNTSLMLTGLIMFHRNINKFGGCITA